MLHLKPFKKKLTTPKAKECFITFGKKKERQNMKSNVQFIKHQHIIILE